MAVTESKLKTGKLTLGGTAGTPEPAPPTGGEEFSCQATNVRIVPSFNEEGDEVETLCGDKLAPDTTTSWNLQGTSIQDFDNPESFIKYTWDNNLTDVLFSWQPNAGETVVYGSIQVRALEMGGDVNTRITSDFDFPLNGDPTVVWPAVVEDPAADGESEPQAGETTAYSTP